MSWPDQVPPATDVILHLNVPCAGPSPARLEIDKLADGRHWATVGTLLTMIFASPDRELFLLLLLLGLFITFG
jgi:hypothetical protein